MTLFGEERLIGSIDAGLMTDLISIVNANKKKGVRMRLSEARLAAVDAELRAHTAHEGIDGLVNDMNTWRAEYRAKFDAATHYDDRRAAAYTTWNSGSQEMLSRRCLEIACLTPSSGEHSCFSLKSGRERVAQKRRAKRLASEADDTTTTTTTDTTTAPRDSLPLIVDVGCGTGLSSIGALDLGYTVIGLDYAPSMLHGACTALVAKGRCDIREGIPVRTNSAAAVLSVGALHYLGMDAAACSSFMKHVARVLVEDGVFTAQFFPPEEGQVGLLEAAAGEAGLVGVGFQDQPHRTNARRWFFVARRAVVPEVKARKCLLYEGVSPCSLSCGVHLAANGLDFPPLPTDETPSHALWLWKEHLRFAHKLVRTHRHSLSTTTSVLAEHDTALAERVIAVCGETSVLEATPDLWKRIHDAMHV